MLLSDTFMPTQAALRLGVEWLVQSACEFQSTICRPEGFFRGEWILRLRKYRAKNDWQLKWQ